MSEATLFGTGFDAVVRKAGGWPDGAVAYAVEVVGQGDDPMVLVTGAVPIGAKRDGSPKFGPLKTHPPVKAGILLSEYRKALGAKS